jgi:hypothetical protein
MRQFAYLIDIDGMGELVGTGEDRDEKSASETARGGLPP